MQCIAAGIICLVFKTRVPAHHHIDGARSALDCPECLPGAKDLQQKGGLLDSVHALEEVLGEPADVVGLGDCKGIGHLEAGQRLAQEVTCKHKKL
jgi:hypothetical protein